MSWRQWRGGDTTSGDSGDIGSTLLLETLETLLLETLRHGFKNCLWLGGGSNSIFVHSFSVHLAKI